jgi:hypothetical protein
MSRTIKTSQVRYLNRPADGGSYVYVFRIDGQFAYVGKGSGKRLFQHERAALHHRRCSRWQVELGRALRRAASVEAIVAVDGLSRSEADDVEVSLIERFGRRDIGTGTLYNLTPGGDGLSSAEAKRQWADPRIRNKHIRERERRSRNAVARARLALGQRRGWADPEIRARRVATNRATLARPGVREKQLRSCAITNQKPEVKVRRSESARRLHRDPAYRARLYSALRRAANRPERVAQVRVQMSELNRDPEFTRKRIAGIKRYWETRRRLAQECST